VRGSTNIKQTKQWKSRKNKTLWYVASEVAH